MGLLRAMIIKEGLKDGSLSTHEALHLHLSGNLYPPMPASMIPVGLKVLRFANRGAWGHKLRMPEGIKFRGSSTATVKQLVESMRLDTFIDTEVVETEQFTCELCGTVGPTEDAKPIPGMLYMICSDCWDSTYGRVT